MTASSLEAQGVRFKLSSEEEIANISAPGPKIKKVRTLFFLKLLKLNKRKCPYFFDFWPRSRDIGNSSSDDNSNLTPRTSKEEMLLSRLLGQT